MKRLDRRVPLALLVLALGACDAILGIPERSLGPRLDCSGGKCDCEPGWGNCDGRYENGCEVNLESDLNCGACGKRCENSACVDGACACAEGYADCDGLEDNGCETDLRSELDCGGCGQRCDNGKCLAGACACLPGHVDCDGLATNGCEATFDSDAANCGSCGHRCADGACEGGLCLPVVLLKASISQMALVDDNLCYTASDAIHKVPKTGGTPVTLCESLTPGTGGPFKIWNGVAYWTSGGKVSACPLDGSAQKVLGQLSTPDNGFIDIVVGGGYVYWLEETALSTPVELLFRARADGSGTPSKLFSFKNHLNSIFADDTSVYWVDGANKLTRLDHGMSTATALSTMPAGTRILKKDGEELYILSLDGYARWPLSGGAPLLLAPPSFYCAAKGCEAFDQDYLYFFADSSIQRVPLAGGEVSVVLSTKGGSPGFALAVDQQFVYFANDSSVRRVEK